MRVILTITKELASKAGLHPSVTNLLAAFYTEERMDNRVEHARDAIDDMFADTSVAQSETRERLNELRDHINMLLESLD